MKYLAVLERGETGWGAHVPDLPGCIAVGETEDEVRELIREAIDQHVALLLESGQPIPPPRTRPCMVEVAG